MKKCLYRKRAPFTNFLLIYKNIKVFIFISFFLVLMQICEFLNSIMFYDAHDNVFLLFSFSHIHVYSLLQ